MDKRRPPASPDKITNHLAIRLHLLRDDGSSPIEIFRFEAAEITIGRAASKGRPPTLALADRNVSRRHCAILVDATSLTIEDRGGQAGTFLRGRRLSKRRRIQPGQRFTFAGYTAWIERLSIRPRPSPERRQKPALAKISAPRLPEPWQPGKGPEMWVLKGEPDGLLLRGRALKRGKIWLKGHVTLGAWDLRKRWLEASLQASARRGRHLRLRGLALLIALACAIKLGMHTVPKPPAVHPAPSCLKAEITAIHRWVLDDRSNAMRAAIALAWAKSKGCRSGTIEGLLHQALSATRRQQIAQLNEAGTGVTAIAGTGAVLITTDTRALHISHEHRESAIGSGGRWHISGDGRWAAESLDGEQITLWALDAGTPVARDHLVINSPTVASSDTTNDMKALADGPRNDGYNYSYNTSTNPKHQQLIQSIALDRQGDELWIATPKKLLRWRREGPSYQPAASLANTLEISATDRMEVGIGGIVVGRDRALWWQSSTSGRSQRLAAIVDRWLLVDGGTTLITSEGAVIRRWRIRRRRPVSEVIAELSESVLHMTAIPGGHQLAVATSKQVLLLDTEQRWRRRQALSRTLTYKRRAQAIDSLISDPAGRWLAAIDPSGAAIWRLHRGILTGAPMHDLDWGITTPEHLIAIDNALVGIIDGRVLRWPLLDSPGGMDGIAVTHGEPTQALATDPTGRWIASAGASQARLWRHNAPLSLEPLATLNLESPASAMAFAKNTWLIAHDDTLDVHSLNPHTGIVKTAALSTGTEIAHIAVADNGAWLLAADTRGRLAAWRIDRLNDSRRPLRSWSQGAAISALAVDAKGTQVLLGDRQGGVRSLRLDTTGAARVLADHQGAVLTVAVSSGGEWLASSGEDRRIHISKTADPEHRSQISQVHPAKVRSLTFLGHGTWLAARDATGAITLHATGSAATMRLGVRKGPPSGLSSDGKDRLYAVGEDGLVELWELRLSGPRPRIRAVTELSAASSSGLSQWHFDPQAEQLLSATPSGILRLRPLRADGLVALTCQLLPATFEIDGPVPREFASSICAHI